MNRLYVLLVLLALNTAQASDCPICTVNTTQPLIEDPMPPLIESEKFNYERNPKASFCKRPTEIIDTIVLHHSETPNTSTPEYINEIHLRNGKPKDPWYMIGYSYVINSPYAGGKTPRARVTDGRPMDLVGAHAGKDAFVTMTEDQKKLVEAGSILCGYEGQDLKPSMDVVSNGKIKANVTTIGLVVVGNYAPYSRLNLQGYTKKNPHIPSKNTLDMIARTSCQLQKKYPTIKFIKWHSFYHSTSCPGDLKNYIGQIKTLTRTYGCEFN